VNPQYKFVYTGSKPDSKCDSLKTDISLYKVTADTTLDYSTKEQIDNTNFARMDLFIELKPSKVEDGFHDELLEARSDKGRRTRSQLATYAAAQMATQFRTHLFSVLICGPLARFIRWDRAGAIFTKSFDYVENPRLLALFFYNYTRLSSEERGFDPTVSVIPDHVHLSENNIQHLISLDTNRDLTSRLPKKDDLPLFVLEIPAWDEGGQSRKVVVLRPKYSVQSPFGRATRGMPGVDLESKRHVFVKDYWRPDVEGVEKEGEIYRRLRQHNVRHISTFYCGNDIRSQATITQSYGDPQADSPPQALEGFQHYRMALLDVGRPLTMFKSTREMINVIADAMEGKAEVPLPAQ
jgi:hypothetical protein